MSFTVVACSSINEAPLTHCRWRLEPGAPAHQVPCLHDVIANRAGGTPAACCGDCPLGDAFDEGKRMVAPLVTQGQPFGCITAVTAGEPEVLDQELELLAALAADLGRALDLIAAERERARAERELAASERLLLQTGRTARVGGWTIDACSGRISRSQVAREILELPPGVESGLEDGAERFYGDDHARLGEAVQRALATGEPFRITVRLRTSSGGERWVETRGVPVREGDEIVRLAGTLQDVTEQRRSDEALRRSEESFRLVIERSPDAVAVQRRGRIVYVNDAAVQMLGYDHSSELVGRAVLELAHPDDRELVWQRIEDMELRGERAAAPHERRFLRRDGTSVVVEVVSVPVVFEGEPATVAISRDLTERKELTARIMEMDRMIAVGTLAAGVGHEINNPLSYVMANLSFAADRLDHLAAVVGQRAARDLAEVREVLEDAREGSERIRDTVRDLKTLSRADEDERAPFAVHEVINSALDMAFNEIRHRARLVKDFAPVPGVYGNKSRIGQVFLNLVVNAAHAIDEGAAERNEICVRTFERDGQVVVEVHDSGAGIAPDDLLRIFDPFFTTKPVGHGTGIGLSICRQTVEKNGGRIEVESELGVGSVFRVVLPPAAEQPVVPSAPPTDAPRASRRGRILVVDDEPLIAEALARLLEDEHDVVAVTSARTALEHARSGERFDLVFCDLMMPEMTGMDLYGVLRTSHPQLAERFIFVTGGAFTPRAQQFLDGTPNPRLEKPFESENLRAMVRDLLE